MTPAVARALAYPFDPHPEPFLYRDGKALPLDHADASLFLGRVPILAVGSNASPKRLAEKFAPGAWTPVSFAEVDDHVVAHSAKITAYGSMPATLHPWPGARARVHATWLTEAQLEEMDGTEALGVEYVRVAIGCRLVETPAYVGAVETYASIAGALAVEGAPGGDVELDAVPGAGDYLALAHPGELPARRCRAGGGAIHRPGAERPELVRADVRKGVQFASDVEDADLDTADLHDAVAGGREIVDCADDVFCHLVSVLRSCRRGWESRRASGRSHP